MIGWGDVYKVVAATAPLYFALFLGYGSVRWWRIFTREQCDAVNRLVAFFALPFFTFEFTLHTDPFQEVGGKPSVWRLVKTVAHKLARNPNTYASFVGITWACVANRLHMELPSVLENSVLIMSKSGTGMAMFSMGLFMAQQERILACGLGYAALGLALKFGLGPVAMAIGSIAVGLRGDVLRVAIIQARTAP
ncbi:unnamed protein product [Triticum turgidum subsp. durum]|uniref:Auxin efflux carrier component n=1 Tax=Triticum turgidum subsp. durum TaxID=4567 RepID=A0A9R0RXR8_TRITD|nr:unnamed protein product [Triticum turgidum subsp. durum]